MDYCLDKSPYLISLERLFKALILVKEGYDLIRLSDYSTNKTSNQLYFRLEYEKLRIKGGSLALYILSLV
jgi:hypothetical protein